MWTSMKSISFKSRVVIAVSMVLSVLPLSAKQPPPFGESITWSTGKEAPSLEGMRGKSVLVVFFQSWCGICNGWSPEFFDQMGKAYGDDPLVTLVAIKTDGGGLDDAMKYLEGKTDADNWIVGADEGAAYYRQATGDDKLYMYMWVKPDGSVGKIDKAGMYFTQKNTKMKDFVIASEREAKEFRKGAKPLMATEPPLDDALKPAINLAEQGLFLGALAEVAKQGSNADLEDDVAVFKKQIADRLESSVERYAAAIDDDENEDRYLAYLALTKIVDDFGASAPGQASKKAVAEHSSAAWLSDEKAAEKDYQSIMRRAERADDERSRERIAKALAKLGEEYPETMYGRIAFAAK